MSVELNRFVTAFRVVQMDCPFYFGAPGSKCTQPCRVRSTHRSFLLEYSAASPSTLPCHVSFRAFALEKATVVTKAIWGENRGW